MSCWYLSVLDLGARFKSLPWFLHGSCLSSSLSRNVIFLLRFLPSIVLLLEWVGSNHRSRSQSPLPYHLATFQYKPSCKLFILQKQQQDLCAHHLPTVSYLSPTRFLLILCCFFIVRNF